MRDACNGDLVAAQCRPFCGLGLGELSRRVSPSLVCMNDDNSSRVIIHRLSYTTIATCEGQPPPVAQLAVRSRPSTSDPVQPFSEWRLIQYYTSESSRQQYSYSIIIQAGH